MKNLTIDATEKSIGRVAAEAAQFLMGKTDPSYERNKVSAVKVVIDNAGKTKVSDKKGIEKEYERYSGYPGGFRTLSLAETIEKKGFTEVYRLAVYGMLPRNKLRPIMMKNLTINE